MLWFPSALPQPGIPNPEIVGNYYTSQFNDAWDAAEEIASQIDSLERRTVRFVSAFTQSNLPDVVKEAALFNISTLRTQTVFRTPDGHLFGWEGCGNNEGSCHGFLHTCLELRDRTRVALWRSVTIDADVEMQFATDIRGLMSFRIELPLSAATTYAVAAADGQMGTLVRLYRDWKLSGDDQFLSRNWPGAKRAMEFAWVSGGWDADQDGVMEGCQHNTMDVEYFGPNPQMGFWYLCALRACEEMSSRLGDTEFADKCRTLFVFGSNWLDDNLFNGEYYEHIVVPPMSREAIAEGLLHKANVIDDDGPHLQLGRGCLIDQLVGQYWARLCDFGVLADENNVQKALSSVFVIIISCPFETTSITCGSFVLGDETGTVMATFPLGSRPAVPFPYFNEVMTGFEYTAAVGMIQEGMVDEGLSLIEAVRDRYDGRRRNPFNEAECGHHYARAMASWSAVLALTGFDYDARTGTLLFNLATVGDDMVLVVRKCLGHGPAVRRRSRRVIDARIVGGSTPILKLGVRRGNEVHLADASVSEVDGEISAIAVLVSPDFGLA